MDNFAASLIYFSVKILSIDNELWHKFTGGDECILFRDRDLKNPLQSEIFAFIQEHKSKELREAALIIRQLLAMEIDKVPPLDEVLKWQPSKIAQLESNLPKIEPENIRRQSNRNNTTSTQTKLAGATKENEQWWSAHTQNSGSPNSQHQAAPFQSNKQGMPKPTAKATGFQHKPALLFCTAAGIVITVAGFAGYAQYQKFVQDTKTNEQIIKQLRELERASSQRKASIAPPVQTPAPPKKQAQPREAMEDRCTFDLNYAQKLEETATPANKQLAQAELNYYRVNILYKDKQLNDREEALVNRAKQGLVRTYWEDMDATQKNIELERVVGTASIAVLDSADSAMKNNNYNKAIELYTKFLKTKIDSNSAITIIAHGRAYSHLAKTYLAKGDLKNAKISAIKSLQLFRYITGDDSVDSLQALLLLCDVSDRMNEKQFAILSCARVVDASEGKAYFTEVYKDALALQKRLVK